MAFLIVLAVILLVLALGYGAMNGVFSLMDTSIGSKKTNQKGHR